MARHPEPQPDPPAHAHERFNPWARPFPLEGWAYEVDDFGPCAAYGTGRWYPFQRGTRLAPDCAYYAWGTQYVLLWPGARSHEVSADFSVALREQGMGAVFVRITAELDMRRGGTVIRLRPDDLTGDVRDEALVRARRVLDLIARERVHRRAGQERPITAHDRYLADQRDGHDHR